MLAHPASSAAAASPDDEAPRPARRPIPPGLPRLRPWRPFGTPTERGKLFRDRLAEFPYISVGLVALFVVVYALMWVAGSPMSWSGLRPLGISGSYAYREVATAFGINSPELLAKGEWWRLLSAAFLHGPPFHLMGNAFALYFLGRLVENFYGARRLIAVFVIAAIGASGLSAALSKGPALGASGGVMGLLGVALVFGLRHRHEIPSEVRDFFTHFLWFFTGVVLLVGFGVNFAVGPVIDNWAHVGGMLVGIAMGWWMRPRRLEPSDPPQRPIGHVLFAASLAAVVGTAAAVEPRISALPGTLSDPQLREAQTLIGLGEYDNASRLVRNRVTPDSDDLFTLLIGYELALASSDWTAVVAWRERIEQVDPDGILEATSWWLGPAEQALGQAFLDNELAWALARGRAWDADSLARAEVLIERALEALPEGDSRMLLGQQTAFLNTRAVVRLLADDLPGALEDIEGSMERRDQLGLSHGADAFVKVIILFLMGREDEARDLHRRSLMEFEGGELRAEARLVVSGKGYPRYGVDERGRARVSPPGTPPPIEPDPAAEILPTDSGAGPAEPPGQGQPDAGEDAAPRPAADPQDEASPAVVAPSAAAAEDAGPDTPQGEETPALEPGNAPAERGGWSPPPATWN